MRGPFLHDSLVVPPVRRVYCVHYDDCLNAALALNWISWCCRGCTGYQEISAEQKLSDMFGLLKLVGEAWIPRGAKKRREP